MRKIFLITLCIWTIFNFSNAISATFFSYEQFIAGNADMKDANVYLLELKELQNEALNKAYGVAELDKINDAYKKLITNVEYEYVNSDDPKYTQSLENLATIKDMTVSTQRSDMLASTPRPYLEHLLWRHAKDNFLSPAKQEVFCRIFTLTSAIERFFWCNPKDNKMHADLTFWKMTERWNEPLTRLFKSEEAIRESIVDVLYSETLSKINTEFSVFTTLHGNLEKEFKKYQKYNFELYGKKYEGFVFPSSGSPEAFGVRNLLKYNERLTGRNVCGYNSLYEGIFNDVFLDTVLTYRGDPSAFDLGFFNPDYSTDDFSELMPFKKNATSYDKNKRKSELDTYTKNLKNYYSNFDNQIIKYVKDKELFEKLVRESISDINKALYDYYYLLDNHITKYKKYYSIPIINKEQLKDDDIIYFNKECTGTGKKKSELKNLDKVLTYYTKISNKEYLCLDKVYFDICDELEKEMRYKIKNIQKKKLDYIFTDNLQLRQHIFNQLDPDVIKWIKDRDRLAELVVLIDSPDMQKEKSFIHTSNSLLKSYVHKHNANLLCFSSERAFDNHVKLSNRPELKGSNTYIITAIYPIEDTKNFIGLINTSGGHYEKLVIREIGDPTQKIMSYFKAAKAMQANASVVSSVSSSMIKTTYNPVVKKYVKEKKEKESKK